MFRLLGLLGNRILCIDPKTEDVVTKFPLVNLRQWACNDHMLVLTTVDMEETSFVSPQATQVGDIIQEHVDELTLASCERWREAEEETEKGKEWAIGSGQRRRQSFFIRTTLF